MKTYQIKMAFLAASFAVCLSLDAQLKQVGSASEPLVEANSAFAIDLFNQLKGDSGNLFFSPYGVSTVLALTYAGARGQTQKQMRNVLHFANVPDVTSQFGLLQSNLLEVGRQNGVELSIANALWTQQGYLFLPDFLSAAKGCYAANVNQADFKTAADAARNQINAWVAQQTRDKIQDILPPGSIDDYTRLVLANAIYFKGLWETPYRKSHTANQPFYISPTNQMSVPLMHETAIVGYMENNDFQAAAMFYDGGLDMLVFLPRQSNGCAGLERSLTPALISATLRDLRPQEIEIFLPRFKLESTFRLDDVLARMGMPNAFDGRADFSGMDGSSNLYISGIFHQSWCEVTEEGTEAAATTWSALQSRSMESAPPPPPPVFRADHPFVFFIRDPRSGSILFMGRLAKPMDCEP